jgi:chromosome segregation ATPase
MRYVFAIVVTVGVLAPSHALAQSTPPVQRDVIAELLVEVRGLRQAMERAATVGARIQLLVARVQLQEQRIAESSRRLVTVREQLSKIDADIAAMLLQANTFEKVANSFPPEQKEDHQRMVETFKAQAATLEKRKLDLANEESLLLQQVSADQNRWSDVNGQLDDIERALAAPPRK